MTQCFRYFYEVVSWQTVEATPDPQRFDSTKPANAHRQFLWIPTTEILLSCFYIAMTSQSFHQVALFKAISTINPLLFETSFELCYGKGRKVFTRAVCTRTGRNRSFALYTCFHAAVHQVAFLQATRNIHSLFRQGALELRHGKPLE